MFVIAILNPCSYFERDGNCTKLAQHYQWAYGNTSTNFQDDLTFILENCKIRVFPKILRYVKHFKISESQTCSVIITE